MKQSESKSVEKWRRRSILKTVDGRKDGRTDGRTTDATPWHKLIGSFGPDELKTYAIRDPFLHTGFPLHQRFLPLIAKGFFFTWPLRNVSNQVPDGFKSSQRDHDGWEVLRPSYEFIMWRCRGILVCSVDSHAESPGSNPTIAMHFCPSARKCTCIHIAALNPSV